VILQAAATAASAATKANEPDFMMYAGSAVFLVGLAWAVMRWVGKTIKQDIDPTMTGKMRASMAIQAEVVPPALVKEALAKGLVTSVQLATMSPQERQFLFATLKPKLDGSAAPAARAAPVLPLKPTAPPTTPVNAPQLRSTQSIATVPGKPASLPPLTADQRASLGPPPAAPRTTPVSPISSVAPDSPLALSMPAESLGDEMLPDAEGLRVYCPCCGTLLAMPVFPPHVAFCDQCGAKTAVRTEDQGRLIINTAPPGVTRRPLG